VGFLSEEELHSRQKTEAEEATPAPEPPTAVPVPAEETAASS